MKMLREEFDKYDKNESGTIDVYELADIFFSMGLYKTKRELESMIDTWDSNGNGQIDFQEYCNIMEQRFNDSKRDDCTVLAFREFDKDGDGCISERDLRHSLFNILKEGNEDPDIKELELICEEMMMHAKTNE